MSSNPQRPGGGFLLAAPQQVFSPDGFDEQQRLIAHTAAVFAQQEIVPASQAIEDQDFAVTRELLRRAGAVGLTGVEVPEAYGGQGLDLVASAIVADNLAVQGSFSVAFGAHVGIGTLPLVHFGSEEQKQRYLPRLASSEWIAAYALSEASSGSDAMALQARAEPSSDGDGYRLHGEKMWISNAGIADLFTVFAKVGEHPTAFLVEVRQEGVSTGPEEHKMGIQGASTRALLLRNVHVSAANRLGEEGDGAKIAFHILNIGRLKLAAACLGGARQLLRDAASYASRRHAFGRPIAGFGLVQAMLGRMAAGIFAAESAVYRTAELMAGAGLDEYGVECSLVKVQASEMLDQVVDDAVQIHGGNGFVRGEMAERAYRDARVNRIFEGTNEINRLLASGLLLRRAAKGQLALAAASEALIGELLGPARDDPPWEQARKATLLAAGIAHRRFRQELADEQEILAMIADLAAITYAMQSVAVRRPNDGLTGAVLAMGLEASHGICRRALAAISEGDELRTQLAWLRKICRQPPGNLVALQRAVAQRVLECGGYPA